jgi:3-hydroxybutyryl-CoA dehydrogenase
MPDHQPQSSPEFADPTGIAADLLIPFLARALVMQESGYAAGADIDTAVRLGCGLARGPLTWLAGLDQERAARHLAADPHWRFTTDLRTGLRRFRESRRRSIPAARWRPESVVIVGSGGMATGIAHVVATSGHPVTMITRTPARSREALARVDRSLSSDVRRGRLDAVAADAAHRRVDAVETFDACAGAELVIEAVAEDIELKRQIFGTLGARCRPDALLASTTSSLSIRSLARAAGRPAAVIGMHFFSPVPRMPLVEVIRHADTDDGVVSAATQFALGLGKDPIVCRDAPGFIVTALLFAYLEDAIRLVDRGTATYDQVDQAMRDAGMPMGPFELQDAIGLDVSLQILKVLSAGARWHHEAPPSALVQLVEQGNLGRKTGRGFLPWRQAPSRVALA